MVHANIIYSNREIQEILRNKTNESTLYLMYDDIFFEKINKNENISREFYQCHQFKKNTIMQM